MKRRETKTAQIIQLMRRGSVTRPQVLALTGWKAISMQHIAANAKVKLKIQKPKRTLTRYWIDSKMHKRKN